MYYRSARTLLLFGAGTDTESSSRTPATINHHRRVTSTAIQRQPKLRLVHRRGHQACRAGANRPDAERRHLAGEPGVLAGRRCRTRGGRVEGARGRVRGLRHAGREEPERRRRGRRREGGVVQGQRRQHPRHHSERLIHRTYRRLTIRRRRAGSPPVRRQHSSESYRLSARSKHCYPSGLRTERWIPRT